MPTRRAHVVGWALAVVCVPVDGGRQLHTPQSPAPAFEHGAALPVVPGMPFATRRQLVGRLVSDSLLDEAQAALADGRPWRATQLLDSVLRNATTRTPRAVLLAASAAAEWRGWNEVVRLLRLEPWLDRSFDGAGHALLARAALESTRPRRDALALRHSHRAVAQAPDDHERGVRLVTHARALERAGQNDSARVAYARAAALMPDVADWLRLRAVSLTADRAARARLVAALHTDLARSRAPYAEAAALERTGEVAAAASLRDSLGDPVGTIRLRLLTTRTAASRAPLRRALGRIVDGRRSPSARDAAALLDRTFTPLTPHEQLAIAQSAAAVGPATRAIEGYEAAFRARLGTASDRYTYGRLLERLGRHDDAVRAFARAAAEPALAGRARYQQARSTLRAGRLAESRAQLRRIVRDHGSDIAAAAPALFLLADLATDEGRDHAARAAFLELARRYPRSSLAPRAAFRAAVIAFAHDSARRAAREFDAVAEQYGRSDEATAARYWAGRAWARSGNTDAAGGRWRTVRTRDPRSYYALLASRRLGAPAWAPSTGSEDVRASSTETAIARAALLERLGLHAEARREYDWIEKSARTSTDALLGAAAAFRAHDHGGRAIRLAAEALRRGAPRDATVYRLLYPLAYDRLVVAESEANGIDPALVAALIRQESSFTPSARSSAGARGLMQIMPRVGRRAASARGFTTWDDALLYQPDISVHLGTAHLASLMAQYGTPERVLAAYNAGGSRVDRWARKAGTSDPELFVERIPYTETREYVRVVLRNHALYRRIYALDQPTPPTPDPR